MGARGPYSASLHTTGRQGVGTAELQKRLWMKLALFASLLFAAAPLATSGTVEVCEKNAGQWFTQMMLKDEIVHKAEAHCMKSKKHQKSPFYCPRYVAAIREQFKRAPTKDNVYSLKGFCELIDKYAELEDHVAIDHHNFDVEL